MTKMEFVYLGALLLSGFLLQVVLAENDPTDNGAATSGRAADTTDQPTTPSSTTTKVADPFVHSEFKTEFDNILREGNTSIANPSGATEVPTATGTAKTNTSENATPGSETTTPKLVNAVSSLENTTTPSLENNTTPSLENNTTPSLENPTATNVKNPATPSLGIPTTLGLEIPTTPGLEIVTTPDLEVTTTPILGIPTTPSLGIPTTPSFEISTTISLENPTTPSLENPTTPILDIPTTPGLENPTTPGLEILTTPGLENPTTLKVESPTPTQNATETKVETTTEPETETTILNIATTIAPRLETTTPIVETTTSIVETTTPIVETTTPLVETTVPIEHTTQELHTATKTNAPTIQHIPVTTKAFTESLTTRNPSTIRPTTSIPVLVSTITSKHTPTPSQAPSTTTETNTATSTPTTTPETVASTTKQVEIKTVKPHVGDDETPTHLIEVETTTESEISPSSTITEEITEAPEPEDENLVTVIVGPGCRDSFPEWVAKLETRFTTFVSDTLNDYLEEFGKNLTADNGKEMNEIRGSSSTTKFVGGEDVVIFNKAPFVQEQKLAVTFYVNNPHRYGNFVVFPSTWVVQSLENRKTELEDLFACNVTGIYEGLMQKSESDEGKTPESQSWLLFPTKYEPLIIALIVVIGGCFLVAVCALIWIKCTRKGFYSQSGYDLERKRLKEVGIRTKTFDGQDLNSETEILRGESNKHGGGGGTGGDGSAVVVISGGKGSPQIKTLPITIEDCWVVPFKEIPLDDKCIRPCQDTKL